MGNGASKDAGIFVHRRNLRKGKGTGSFWKRRHSALRARESAKDVASRSQDYGTKEKRSGYTSLSSCPERAHRWNWNTSVHI